MEERRLKVLFGKSGAGSINTRICLPITDLKKMGVTPENREVIYFFDEEKKEMIIKKAK